MFLTEAELKDNHRYMYLYQVGSIFFRIESRRVDGKRVLSAIE